MMAGILIVLLVFAMSVHMDLERERQQLLETLAYMKGQAATYVRFNEASETKSLMRAIENAQQVSRNITYLKGGKPTEDDLMTYVREQRLTGIILLDPEGTITLEYDTDGLGTVGLEEYIEKNAVLNVAKYPQKTYAARIDLEDGSYIDFSACSRKDTEGVVVTYYHTSAEYAHTYNLTIQSLMDGYSIGSYGTIVVTSGNRIIASNDKELVDGDVDDFEIIHKAKEKCADGRMSHILTGTGGYYASLDKGREYYFYIYVPEHMVLQSVFRNLLYAVLIYVLIAVIIQQTRRKAERVHQEEQHRKEVEYREQLEEAARKAEDANRAKTLFLQRMSHDIRTPINGIRGMVEMGDYYREDMEKQTECRAKIWEASGFLLELVNEVLDMGKLESGEIVLEERSFDLHAMLTEIVDVVDKQARERGITIHTEEYQIDHPYLIGSPIHVKRLLMNIMSNSVKYGKDDGWIELDCHETDYKNGVATIKFICKDNGIGMSKDFQEHIYEPFAQESNGARSIYGGSGLGMSIARSLAEEMGGSISFESEQGVGSIFYITLPFTVDKSTPVSEEKKGNEETPSIQGMHILIAEDNELNMEIAQFVLESAGAVVTKAVNGREAVDIFAASAPGELQVILMDIMMPEMDGLEAARCIRRLPREDAKTIPIIAMTANAFVEDRQAAFEAGMTEHLSKPLESSVLIETISRLCKKKA